MDHGPAPPQYADTNLNGNIKVRTTGHANLIGSQIQAGGLTEQQQ
jgi:hypothetical protein